MKKLTLDKIAELAGVSRATVSRVVNNYPHIKPEVRERVQTIISETGYRPNLIARSLASERSGIIGLLVPESSKIIFTDPFFPMMVQGISQASNRIGLTLTLFLFKTHEEESRTVHSILGSGLLDGVIIMSDRKVDSLTSQFEHHELPFVLIGRPRSSAPEAVSYVNTANISGARIAVEHLISLGRRRIGLVGAVENTAGDDRTAGYTEALTAHGLPVDRALMAFGDFTMQSGYEAMKQLLPARPDAVFSASDTMALGALRAIREAGLRVPEDIAVVGFDDLPPALQAEPQLTTIHQPIEELGAAAVDLLSEMIDKGDTTPSHRLFPTWLIIRASCGAQSTSS